MVTRTSWAWLVWAGCNPTYIPPVEDDCEVLDGAICLDGTLGETDTNVGPDEETDTATGPDSDSDTDVDTGRPGEDTADTGLGVVEVVSVMIQPSSGVVNTSVLTCEVTVTPDPSGVSVTYAWSNATTSTVLGDDPELVLDASLALPGDEVKCAVTASDGMHSDDGEASVTVGNRAPVVSALTIEPSTAVFNDTTLTCAVTATDPDGPTPTVTYAWGNETQGVSLGTDASVTLTSSTASPGDVVRCTVTASDGVLSDAGSDTVVVGNRRPVVGTPTLSPDPFFNDSTVTCAASASDADGTTPTVTYAWSNQTTSSGLGSGFSLTLTPSAALPDHEIRCTATASDGSLTAEASVTGTVGNRAPVVSVPTLAPSRPSVGGVATCAATASDPDGTTPAITYVWRNVTEDRVFGSGAQVTVPLADVALGDTVRCEATASDGELSDTRSSSGAATWEAGESMTTARLGTVRYIPPGSFVMGCVEGRDDVAGVVCEPASPVETEREVPTRTVMLTRGFWMMESELTQGMWGGLGLTHNSRFTGANLPVERVNWWEAVEVANEASRRDGLAECYELTGCSTAMSGQESLGGGCPETTNCEAGTYTCASVAVTSASGHPKDCEGWRLPTEAEWEHAARAGTSFPYAGGVDLDAVAWYSGNNSPSGTKGVCTTSTPRNAWGLCDLSGNVWEWTWDWYESNYAGASIVDSVGPPSGSDRVYRGGSWGNAARFVRTSIRVERSPSHRHQHVGLRLVRTAP